MKYIKPYNESKVQKKIDFLELLSVDLSDMGLSIEIRNGKTSIVMVISDLDNVVAEHLRNSTIIEDFLLKLEDIEMSPREVMGGPKLVIISFDKHGSLTDSSFI